jgi:hypothetical protein
MAKTPDMFADARLLACDFDLTVAHTFEKPPNGIDVGEAYSIAIEDTFGTEALQTYLQAGGLHNRAPLEVVQSLRPDANTRELDELADQLKSAKLTLLLDQIGTRFADGTVWPRIMPGYLEFKERLEQVREDGVLIDDIIVSSGHHAFIAGTYEAWGIPKPTGIVSEELMRTFPPTMPPEALVKPSRLVMQITRNIWRTSYDVSPDEMDVSGELERIVYAGDDPNKDGQLAENSGVAFVLIDPNNSAEGWQRVATRLDLGALALEGANYPNE